MEHLGLPSNHRTILTVLLLAILASVAGCGGEAGPLTEECLKNAKYQGVGIYPEAVKLTDGEFKGYFVAGGSSRSTVILAEPYAFWDLDGDGVDDAAVLLVENTGGGIFVYLAAVLNQRGKPVNVATTLLSDGVQVEDLAIDAGQIRVSMLTHSPGDPMCCPSEKTQVAYALEGGEFGTLRKKGDQSQQ